MLEPYEIRDILEESRKDQERAADNAGDLYATIQRVLNEYEGLKLEYEYLENKEGELIEKILDLKSEISTLSEENSYFKAQTYELQSNMMNHENK